MLPFAPKCNLDGGGSMEANLTIFRGGSVSNKGVFSPIPETSQVFIGETEGDEGISCCNLVNKVCPPFSASSEQVHPLARAFAPKSLPVSSVSTVHHFRCQPFFFDSAGVNFASQGVPFSNSPGVELSHRVGMPFSEGMEFPVEASN